MKLEPTTIRVLSRLTDRMDLMRKHPLRYDIDADAHAELVEAATRLEAVLGKVRTVKVG